MYSKLKNVVKSYPLVSYDQPEWKRTCPFCGAKNSLHVVDNVYVCHECIANWREQDTENARLIQIYNLNFGNMPSFYTGDMPLIPHTFEKVRIACVVNIDNSTITCYEEEDTNDKRASSF